LQFHEYPLLYKNKEDKMKKLIIILLILIILGAVCFILGWMNLYVPADAFAVMVSKTGGYDDVLIQPDSKFIWRWENIIPSNMTLYVFKPDVYTSEIKANGSFPSAETYGQFDKNTDFTFNIEIALAFRFNEQYLLSLVKNDHLTPETLSSWYKTKEEQLSGKIYSFLFSLKTEEDLKLLMDLREFENKIKSQLQKDFQDLNIIQITPLTPLKLPDPELYLMAKSHYLEILNARKEYELELISRQKAAIDERDINYQRSQYRLNQLKEYGELLNKYPILLKFLFIEKLSGEDLLKVPQTELFEKTE
jgi:hypothetical protein